MGGLLYLTSPWPESTCFNTVGGGIPCKGSYGSPMSSVLLAISQAPIGILLVNCISLRTSRLLPPPHEQLQFTVRFTNYLALQSPSAFTGVWLRLWEHFHASKLIFGPCTQLLPLQSIKLKERPAIQFWDQMHSNNGSTKLPCASSLRSHDTARPRDCKSLPEGDGLTGLFLSFLTPCCFLPSLVITST